jgi:hypothetical protein
VTLFYVVGGWVVLSLLLAAGWVYFVAPRLNTRR